MSNPQGESNLESITLAAPPSPEGVEGLLSLLLEQWDEQAIESSIEPEELAVPAASIPESERITSIALIDASLENLSEGAAPVAVEPVGQEQFRHELGQLIDPQVTPHLDQPVVPQTEYAQADEQSLAMLFDSIPVQDQLTSPPAQSEPASSVFSQCPIESARIIPFILFEEPVEDPAALLTASVVPQGEYATDCDAANDAALDNLFQSLLGTTELESAESVTEVVTAEQAPATNLLLETEPAEADLLGSLLAGMAGTEITPEQLAPPPQPIVKEIGPPAKFVIFRLAEQAYAIPLQRVLETDRMPRVTFVPGLPSSLRGITNLRGDILPIVDLRQIFGLGETELTAGHRLLVVKSNDDSQVGLIVDALGGLGTFGIDRSPDLHQLENQELKQLLNGRGEHKGQTVNVLDLDKVFTVTELQELAA